MGNTVNENKSSSQRNQNLKLHQNLKSILIIRQRSNKKGTMSSYYLTMVEHTTNFLTGETRSENKIKEGESGHLARKEDEAKK